LDVLGAMRLRTNEAPSIFSSKNMAETNRTRLNLKIDPELKQRLLEESARQGKPISEILDEVTRRHLTGPDMSQQESLEVDLEKVNTQIAKLGKNGDSEKYRELIQRLTQHYPNLPFRKLQLQAINDYRKSPEIWGNKLGVKDEEEIRDACKYAAQRANLEERRRTLELGLGAIYGIELTPEPEPESENNSSEAPKPTGKPSTYRISWAHKIGEPGFNTAEVERAQVRQPAGTLKSFRFPDGVIGFVYEVQQEKYPRPQLISHEQPIVHSCLFDPWSTESLSVPALIELNPSQAKALATVLKDSKPEGDPHEFWKKLISPATLEAYEQTRTKEPVAIVPESSS
jgi:hypothetical protein